MEGEKRDNKVRRQREGKGEDVSEEKLIMKYLMLHLLLFKYSSSHFYSVYLIDGILHLLFHIVML